MPVQTRSATQQLQEAKTTGKILVEARFRCENSCAICKMDMYGEKVFHLPCGHTYHVDCFKQQLQHMQSNNNKCACCRYDLTSALNDNTELMSLIPPSLVLSNELQEMFDILYVYRFISSIEEFNNIIVSYSPVNIIGPITTTNTQTDSSNNILHDESLHQTDVFDQDHYENGDDDDLPDLISSDMAAEYFDFDVEMQDTFDSISDSYYSINNGSDDDSDSDSDL